MIHVDEDGYVHILDPSKGMFRLIDQQGHVTVVKFDQAQIELLEDLVKDHLDHVNIGMVVYGTAEVQAEIMEMLQDILTILDEG